MTADFPFARTLVVLRSERTVKKTGLTTTESRYYLSSARPDQYPPAQWLELMPCGSSCVSFLGNQFNFLGILLKFPVWKLCKDVSAS
jgi:hypothetical protein